MSVCCSSEENSLVEDIEFNFAASPIAVGKATMAEEVLYGGVPPVRQSPVVVDSTHQNSNSAGEMQVKALEHEVASLVKQIDFMRKEKDSLTNSVATVKHEKIMTLKNMTSAVKKATNEVAVLKKDIWKKDREIESILSKFHGLESENQRLKQLDQRKKLIKASKESEDEKKELGAFSFRENQSLRATLDTLRVDLAAERKQVVEMNALRQAADQQCKDMEMRCVRSEQMVLATEKHLDASERKSNAHIFKLYEDIKTLRVGLVGLNGDLASQASKGAVELGEMETERRIIATKLDKLLEENANLLRAQHTMDENLVSQSNLLGSLGAHVHQPPIGSPQRDRRIQEAKKQDANDSHVGQGALSPTAKKGLLMPLMNETEKEHEAVAKLRLANKTVHKLREEHALTKNHLTQANQELERTRAKLIRVEAEAKKFQEEKHQIKNDFMSDTQETGMQLQKMGQSLQFLTKENEKLKTSLDHARHHDHAAGAAANSNAGNKIAVTDDMTSAIQSSPSSSPRYSQSRSRSPGKSRGSPTHSNSNNNSNNKSKHHHDHMSAEERADELGIAKLQLKALRGSMKTSHEEISRLKIALEKARGGTGYDNNARRGTGANGREAPLNQSRSGDMYINTGSSSVMSDAGDMYGTQHPGSANMSSINSPSRGRKMYGGPGHYASQSGNLENEIMLMALNAPDTPSSVYSSTVGSPNSALDGDLNELQALENEHKREKRNLEIKLQKAEYRAVAISKMFQQIPSTLQVAQAEKRILQAKLEKNLETSNMLVESAQHDAKREVHQLTKILESATEEKSLMANQMKHQSDIIQQLNSRLEKQEKQLLSRSPDMDQFTFSLPTSKTSDPRARQQQHQQPSVSLMCTYPSDQNQTSQQSSPYRNRNNAMVAPNKTEYGDESINESKSGSAQLPMSMLSYDRKGDSVMEANFANFNRLQQMMMAIK